MSDLNAGTFPTLPVAVDKIDKLAKCGSHHLEVNDVGFAGFLQQ